MTKITPAQRLLLETARDHGNPWKVGGYLQPWRASRQASIDRLVSRGLLAHALGKGHCSPSITEEGLKIIS